MSGWLAYLIQAVAAAAAIAIMRLRRRGRLAARFTPIEALLGAGSAAALLALTSGPLLVDFLKAYHHAGRAIISDPATLYDCAARAQCYVNLPIVALPFAPLGVLEPYPAVLIFSLLGIGAVAAAAQHLVRRGTPLDAVIWLLILNGPLSYSVRLGNTTHVLLIVLLVAFERLTVGRERLAGALLAVAALIKPPLAIFLPYFVLRGYYRAAGVMAGVAAATVALSVALYGLELHTFWFHEFLLGHGSAVVAAYNVQSVNGFLGHLMTRGHLRNWYPLPMGTAFRVASVVVTATLIAGAAVACWKAGRPRTPRDRYLELSIVLTLAVLTAPISWSHYYLLLLIPVAALLTPGWRATGWTAAAVAAAVVLIAPPVVILVMPGRIASALYARVLISHYFYGGVLLLGALLAVRLMVTTEEAPNSAGSGAG